MPVLFLVSASADIAGDPLPSWNDTAGKKAIVTALDVAKTEGWTVVDMKNDWKKIFPFGSK